MIKGEALSAPQRRKDSQEKKSKLEVVPPIAPITALLWIDCLILLHTYVYAHQDLFIRYHNVAMSLYMIRPFTPYCLKGERIGPTRMDWLNGWQGKSLRGLLGWNECLKRSSIQFLERCQLASTLGDQNLVFLAAVHNKYCVTSDLSQNTLSENFMNELVWYTDFVIQGYNSTKNICKNRSTEYLSEYHSWTFLPHKIRYLVRTQSHLISHYGHLSPQKCRDTNCIDEVGGSFTEMQTNKQKLCSEYRVLLHI